MEVELPPIRHPLDLHLDGHEPVLLLDHNTIGASPLTAKRATEREILRRGRDDGMLIRQISLKNLLSFGPKLRPSG
jgi:hypothetical protein